MYMESMTIYIHKPRFSLITSHYCSPHYCSTHRPQGVIAVAHQLAVMASSAQDQPRQISSLVSLGIQKVQAVHPWEAALLASAASSAAPHALDTAPTVSYALGPMPSPDFSAPQSGAIRDAACSMLLACLDRGRRMLGLKAMQVDD